MGTNVPKFTAGLQPTAMRPRWSMRPKAFPIAGNLTFCIMQIDRRSRYVTLPWRHCCDPEILLPGLRDVTLSLLY